MKKCIPFKINTRISITTLALSLSAGAVFAQTNLVVNGSFETPGGGFQTFPGWFIGPADNNSNFGVTNYPDVAEQGTNYAYFHGNPTDDSQDCLGQTVNLIVGAQYTVSFYLATDGTTLNSGAAMWAVIGPSFGIDYSQDLSLVAFLPNSSNAIPYQKFTTNFTATASSPILSFHGIDATSSILLDNISLTLVVPQLSVRHSSPNSLVFTWTNQVISYLLQTNASLRTTNWVTLTNTPVTVGSSNQIVLPAPASSVFYRLTAP